MPENVCINGVDGAWRWIEAAWDESSYDAESSDWQTITGTLVLGEDDGRIFQQPEPAVTAAIRVKLTVPDSPPTVTTETLPGGTEGEAYSQTPDRKGYCAHHMEHCERHASQGTQPERDHRRDKRHTRRGGDCGLYRQGGQRFGRGHKGAVHHDSQGSRA